MTSINVDGIGDYMDGIPSTGDLADAAASTPVSGGGFDFGKILKEGIQAGLGGLLKGLSGSGSNYSSMLGAGPAAFFDNELVDSRDYGTSIKDWTCSFPFVGPVRLILVSASNDATRRFCDRQASRQDAFAWGGRTIQKDKHSWYFHRLQMRKIGLAELIASFFDKKLLTAETKAATELFISFAPLPIK